MGGKTSSKAKRAWIDRNYQRIAFDINKEDGIAFKEKCKRENVTQAEILKAAVYEFLDKPIPPSKAKF